MDEHNEHLEWSPDPRFPSDPEFYRRVLDHAPTPMLVVAEDTTIVYGNQAMLDLAEWGFEIGASIVDFIHPDDLGTVTDAFFKLVDRPISRVLGSSRKWDKIVVRVKSATGETIPIEVVGTGGVLDPAVGGVIYAIRHAREQDLLSRVLDGLSQGASMHYLLTLVAELISGPPIDLETVVLQSVGDTYLVAASTSIELTNIFRTPLPDFWKSTPESASIVSVEEMPDAVRDRLHALGLAAFWPVAVNSVLTPSTLRIIACSPTHHDPDGGPVNRVTRGAELASAILLRSQSASILDHAAGHDILTSLPNRAAFYQAADRLNPLTERAAIHLDLDQLRTVNADLGEAAGDALLQVAADRLRSECGEFDIIGRVGDDEFSILVGHVEDKAPRDRFVNLALTIQLALSEPIVIAGRPVVISTSIGVAVAEPGVGTGELLSWANRAMQDAKAAGGNHLVRFGVTFGDDHDFGQPTAET